MDANITKTKLPRFIHCENEPKNGEIIHDNRQFIYCPEYLTLVEIIPLDIYHIHYSMDLPQKHFNYYSERYQEEEEYLLVLVQNNIEVVNQSREIEIMQKKYQPLTVDQMLHEAWNYYENYLNTEDQ